MSQHLWEALRVADLGHLAPCLVAHGIVTLPQLVVAASNSRDIGVEQWQIEAILSATHPQEQSAPLGRHDLPVAYSGRRANFSLAVAAGQPNSRKRSLDALDSDILARSTNPANEARLRTYLAICTVWEIPPWPLTSENIRAFGASMKQGGYRSAGIYFQSLCSYQQRTLRTPIPPMIRYCIKDCVRSIKRGLGVTRLKDGFPALGLTLIPVSEDDHPFDISSIPHARDMAVVSTWFMLREIEMAAARASHLRVDSFEVFILIPTYKTDTFGKLTERSLKCTCRIRRHPMCPYHAAVRHLARLHRWGMEDGSHSYPLFPETDGTTPSKAKMVEAIRTVISQTGQALERPDAQGRPLQRFGGHSLRVAGAQMLAASGVPLQLIQLLGRWTSLAIQRYTQESALAVVPDIPSHVLGDDEILQWLPGPCSATPATPRPDVTGRPASPPAPVDSQAVASLRTTSTNQQAQIQRLSGELELLKQAINKPQFAFVKRVRSPVVHLGSTVELSNPPRRWRSKCGWSYGTSNFLRVAEIVTPLRKCKKCFEMGNGSSSDGSSDSDGSQVSDTSSSSNS